MRIRFVVLALATIVVGLAVHLSGDGLPAAVRDVLGDALWAVMICWWIAALVPAAFLAWRAVAALAVCFAVEISQLIHAPALDALRATPAGHLVLGSGYDPRDFAAYAGGVFAAVLVERALSGDNRRMRPGTEQ